MSVVLEYAFRSPGLVLAPTLAATDVRLEVEGVTSPEPIHPQVFTWVEGDVDAFESAMAADPTVTDPCLLSDHGDRRLYRVTATDAVETVLYPLWVELGGEGLEAIHEDGWWHSRVRFPDRESVATYRDRLDDHGVEFRLEGLYEDRDAEPAVQVSPEQREALALAYRRGYFSVPREATTAELADELGVSTQAVSERLRRGYARLVESQLAFDCVDGADE
jgi:hypothetical protein